MGKFHRATGGTLLSSELRVEVRIDRGTIAIRAEVVSSEQQSWGSLTVAVRRVYDPQGATRARIAFGKIKHCTPKLQCIGLECELTSS
jgi:hypothetical protein